MKVGRHEIAGVGTLFVGPRDPSWPASQVCGAVGVAGEDEWTPEHAARRVLRRVASARHQVAATTADLRAVVVWGSLDHMPAGVITGEIAHRIAAGYDLGPIDYVALVNSHGRGRTPGWVTELAVLPVRTGLPEVAAMAWPRGLIAWRRLGR